ncbi:hypothetical protein [Sandaracinus amylolyticus]|uniref:EamA domain-containing protein n=1 Tax=Sandaracinus amylolyticus TaxID=927083 RepID=A0A0F6W0Z5_9BACT|nr:hypothetical protein [Sandaracinus amylolyticus]AKF04712.1 hypothetical protein DB32_001861 [Sandaracinus amylolyticus]
MSEGRTTVRLPSGEHAIWAYAAGYFLAYVPYGLVTKALSEGRLPGAPERVAGLALLPISTAVSAIGMLVFLGASGLWKLAPSVRVAGITIPVPRRATLLSGVCTAAIVLTTTLAYTFEGTSIVAMMLMMRGGVLVIAPIVDLVSRRRVRWYSWIGLGLSALALGDALLGALDARIAPPALLDVAVYLGAYFVRLRLMSRLAKSEPDASHRYFVEEQLVATPIALAVIVAVALLDRGAVGATLAHGLVDLPRSGALGWVVLIGLCSQATGIFGALVLLDARENTFSVPVNRASSILAGVLATALLAWLLGGATPDRGELIGAALVVLAIVVLALGPRIDQRRAAST